MFNFKNLNFCWLRKFISMHNNNKKYLEKEKNIKCKYIHIQDIKIYIISLIKLILITLRFKFIAFGNLNLAIEFEFKASLEPKNLY